MCIIFDPWSRRNLRTASMPHQVTSTVFWVSFAKFHHAAWPLKKKKKIKRGFSHPNAGVAWHQNSRLDSFHTTYQQSPKKGPHGPAHSSLHPPLVRSSSSSTLMAWWLCEPQGGRGTDKETRPRQPVQSMRKHHLTCTLLRLNRVTAMNHSPYTRSAFSKCSCEQSWGQ